MKIRLIERGFDKYSGSIGEVDFVDGVSTRDVTSIEAARIANAMRTETVEDEPKNPSSSQAVLDSRKFTFDQIHEPVVTPIKATKKSWSRVELEEIADKNGIQGLRNIANPMGLRSTSISVLIDMIFKATNPEVEKATVMETQPEPVAESEQVEPQSEAQPEQPQPIE